MANKRYIFKDQYGSANLGQLLYLTVALYENDWLSNPHAHSFTEVFYVVNGCGYLMVDGEAVEVRQGDLAILNPNVLHTEKAKDGQLFEYVVVGIDGAYFSPGKENSGYYIEGMQQHHTYLLTTLNLLVRELDEKCGNYEEICSYLLTALLLRFFRMANMEFSSVPATKIPGECRRVKDYIDSYYHEPISLESLARLAGWDKYYLSHTFSEVYGISPIKYLKDVRMRCCMDLLAHTDHSIAQISEQLGFSSQNYFSQIFHMHTGVSPREYRRRHKTGTKADKQG